MPIYMDRHDVSESVTAENVAQLHQQDLKIQHKFGCRGLTYWFDEKRKTAFCLIEAPDEKAILEMHNQAHGEVPHRVIEVEASIVESFLGRIEDPEKSQKKSLNIINDPAFRTIMVVGIKPFSIKETLDKKVNSIIIEYNKTLGDTIGLYKGSIVKQNPDHLLVSFDSVTNAVVCSVGILAEFEKNIGGTYSSLIKLQIGLDAGVPVNEKDGFFEKSIKTARSYFELVNGTLVVSSEVKELYESENLNLPIEPRTTIVLNSSEEKFLRDLVDFTEREWCNTSFNIDDFGQYLGCSKSKLYRKIVALTGKSPNSFLKEYRLCKALKLLGKNNMNISEVAFETGFNSPAYFSKCFQETFGILPSHYMKSALS